VKRNQVLIGGAAVLAVVLLWYFVIYAPLGDDLSSAQTQTSEEQKKTDSLEADLARLQDQAKNASKQQAQLRKLDAAVPKNPDLAEFIIQANDIAEESGIRFLTIAPTPPAAGEGGASVINMTISISGGFFQLQDYLRLLEQLERLVIVDGISISASGGGSGGTTGTDTADTGTADNGLSVSLTARMFPRAAPTADASCSGTGTGATTTTTVPGGATSSTTAPTTATTAGGT
jgi:Tfp pilus assembly protein PilO